MIPLLVLLLSLPTWVFAEGLTGKPTVVDGDTLQFSVRLYGIDTPESTQQCERAGVCYPCGQEATAHLKALLSRSYVTCHPTGAVTYGRPVMQCRIGRRGASADIGHQMVRDGWALPYWQYISAEEWPAYQAMLDEAFSLKRGMHAGRYVVPERWRRGERLACEGQP